MVTGTVTELWRYPIKSMLGEQVESTEITEHGVTGDRAFALIDDETGKVCSAKRHDLWGGLFRFRARLVSETPRVAHITFPDGSETTTNDADLSDKLSEVLGRKVTLSAMVPANATLEEVWDDVKGPRMYGPAVGKSGENTVIDVTVSLAAPGDFFDAAAIHLITRNTLDEFGRREPDSRFDVRRFRPNIVVDVADTEGFVENGWTIVRAGDLELRTLMPVPRCVMTTLPQDDLPKDSNVLRSTARHNMIDTKVLGDMPCAGLYAMVAKSGTLGVGDQVTAEA
jgi:uncharacterized protein YcbX